MMLLGELFCHALDGFVQLQHGLHDIRQLLQADQQLIFPLRRQVMLLGDGDGQ